MKRVKEKARRLAEYIRFSCRTRRHGRYKRYERYGRDGAEKKALVLFDNVVVPRRLYQVCTLLGVAGFSVYVRIGLKDYLRYNYIGRLIFSRKNTFIAGKHVPKAELIVLDDTHEYAPGPGQKVLRTDYRFFPPDYRYFAENCYFPIMYHPRLMSEENYEYARSLSENSDRKVLALFAGNLDPSRYDSEIITSQFGVDTRAEVIRWITGSDKLRDYVFVPNSYEEFADAMNSGELRGKIVIVDTMSCSIPQGCWLRTLAEVRFFIMAPGLTHPFCHNMAESMSAGAIPVLQYPEFFHPVLEDGKTCYSFRNRAELEDLLYQIVNTVDEGNRETMRKMVVEYHERYLSLNGFKKCIQSFLESERDDIRLIMARRMYTDQETTGRQG